MWKFCRERLPAWCQTPWPATVLVAVAAGVAVFGFRAKIDLPLWLLAVAAILRRRWCSAGAVDGSPEPADRVRRGAGRAVGGVFELDLLAARPCAIPTRRTR